MTTFSTRTGAGDRANRLHRAATAIGNVVSLIESSPSRTGLCPAPDSLAVPSAYAPDPKGAAAAREAIADYYRERGRRVDPGTIVLCASTSEAYSWLFKLLCDPGCNVLCPRPSYPLFDDLAALDSVKLRPYAFGYADGWHLDPATIAPLPSSRGILAVNPNNPTGTFLESAAVAVLFATGLPLIVDEVFADYARDGAFDRSLAGRQDGLNFVLSGLSKVCGRPGLKLSWIIVQGPPDDRDKALLRLEHIADTYLSVNDPVQQNLAAIMASGAAVRARIRERLKKNRNVLGASDLDVLQSDGGWYAIIRTDHPNDEDLAVALVENHGYLAHPGYFYDLPIEGCLVVSLLTAPRTLAAGLAAIHECVS